MSGRRGWSWRIGLRSGALISIPPGQTEAARAIGLTFPKILADALMPQALRHPANLDQYREASTRVSIIGMGSCS